MPTSPTSPTAPVRSEVVDGVAVVELHRPERRNAITGPLLDALADVVEAAGADDSVGSLLLCGAGGAFCSGLDLDEYNADPSPDWLAHAPESIRRAHVALARCPVPVVVALERYAINGGAAFALAGDFVVVGTGAWLQVGEVRLGMAAPNNLAWLVARHPVSVAMRVAVGGARLDGPTLLRMNLAHEVVADEQVRTRAEALAAELAGLPAGAARRMKAAILEQAGLDDPDAWFERAALAAGPSGRPRRLD